MNCNQLERYLSDLPQEALNGPLCSEALVHAENCPRCASRLADEQVLMAGLRSLAVVSKGLEAPVRLETELLRAFRLGNTHPGVLANSSTVGQEARQREPQRHPHDLRFSSRRRMLWLLSAAASLLLLLIGPNVSRRWKSPGSRQAEHLQDHAAKMPAQVEVPTTVSSQTANLPIPIEPKRTPRLKTALRPIADSRLAQVEIQIPRPQHAKKGEDTAGAFDEIKDPEAQTDFLPLMVASPMSPVESGHLVRVRLPRSALQVFGLPMNVERYREPVNADVFVGEDGIARAIRFVR